MRTKTLLLAASALVAGLTTLHAQVYSQNIVGYVNVVLTNGFTMVANPLNATNNDLNTLFPSAGFGDNIYQYVPGTGFTQSTYLGSWSPDLTVNPGSGIFYSTGTIQTNTFTGTVMTGTMTNSIPGGFSIKSSQVPQSDTLENLGLPAGFGDNVYYYRGGAYVQSTYLGSWSPDLSPAVGEAFWYSAGSPILWTRTFNP